MNKDFPIVNLISAPDNVLKTIYTSCRTCYSAQYPNDIFDENFDDEKMLSLVKKSFHQVIIAPLNIVNSALQ